MSVSSVRVLSVLTLFAAVPTMVLARPAYTPLVIFQDAAPPVKLLIIGLVLSIIAALVVCGRKLMQGPRLAGGSAYLRGLRLGGPLAGLVGAAFGALNMAVGLANVKDTPPLWVLAPGGAEIMALILLGLIAGSVAVISNWAVEARIDRTVLGA
ncbi:hypothetical protein [Asticcacaulis sp. YBE204]|uniref:hypothetical protein n=1 Tax=Asticcacaulis sp. YBE204 TaxID=1282363 RepID=UPI0003C3ED4A|nr:hypothetical protein [Asticcacaulis sp. YBE204]ESQ80867.1 hypothetical protein AEYBE204_00675 [Asticcacaulis sp. YBE204]